MATKRQAKQDKGLNAGGIVALVIAGLALIGILAGVVFYVHSGRAGLDQSAGLITANEPTEVTQKADLAEDEVLVTMTDKDGNVVSAVSKKESTTASEEGSAKDSAAAAEASVFKSKTTAKNLGKLYVADTDAFRKAYDGKTVTVSGKMSGKSAKMLYVELETGTKVPMRVYLSSEEQRERFNKIPDSSNITVKGSLGVLYPMQSDAGGFQEMANGLIALDNVSLVK